MVSRHRPAVAGVKQQLGSKEGASFKALLRFYELKQYKKAIKSADSILKAFPDHGETTSMKGLALNALNKKEEAYELVRKGLKQNLQSHICWHVLGLVYRSDQNYTEAIKCYRQALRFDSENQQILRDLSLLQIQTRDTKGFQQTRRILLSLGSTNQINWFAFSLSHLFGKNYEMAMAIFDSYYGTLKATRERPSFEESEMLLYKAMILEESGDREGCLKFLQDREAEIVDLIALREKKAELLFLLSRKDEARVVYEQLLEENPENYDFHRGLQGCILNISEYKALKGCQLPVTIAKPSPEQVAQLKEIYDEYQKRHPRAWSFQRIPLEFLEGDEFKSRLARFLQKCLRKGLPSLFSFFQPMYNTVQCTVFESKGLSQKTTVSAEAITDAKDRVDTIGSLITSYLESLRKNATFPEGTAAAADKQEDPTVLLWTLHFAAQHYNALGSHERALELVDEAIKHTPTLVDSYQVKAAILSELGDLDSAAEVLESGRQLDLADRFTNCLSAKYLLQANQDSRAEEVVSLFTKHEGDTRTNLFEMQCMWYEIAAGNCALRKGSLPLALKCFLSVEKHFKDFVEDQFDFHSYCLRKVTLRSYIALLRMEDTIRRHDYFFTGAHGAIQCYLQMHDFPKAFEAKATDELDFSKMTAAEKKRAKQKARKAAQKAKKKEEQEALAKKKAQEEAAKEGKKRMRKLPVDKDPDGTTAFAEALKCPLEKANSLVQYLLEDNVQALADVFDIQVRRKKYVQALSALVRASKVAKEGVGHPEIHWRLTTFIAFMQQGRVTFAPWVSASQSREDFGKAVDVKLDNHPTVDKVLRTLWESVVEEKDMTKVAREYLAKFKDTSQTFRKVSAMKALLILNPKDSSSLLKQLISITAEEPRVATAVKVHETIVLFSPDTVCPDQHTNQCKARFPRSTYFATASKQSK